MRRSLTGLGVFALLGCLALQTLWPMRQQSPTCDEFSHHIASGYSYLLTHNFRLDPASPPLPRMAAALPLLVLGAKAPLDDISWKEGNAPEFSRQLFHVQNGDLDKFIFWARVPTLLLSIVFGLCVFTVSRKLFGIAAGIVSLVLYCFTPDIIAHSGLATADLAVAFFFFLTLYRFSCYLKAPSAGNLVWTGFVTGLALLSKFSAVLLFPILLISALSARKVAEVRPSRTALFLAVCFFTVWAGYFFEVKPLLKDTPDPAKKAAMYRRVGGERLLAFAENAPVPLSTFSSAIVSLAMHRTRDGRSFLMGEWYTGGRWYYYLVAFLIKNTLPFVLFCLLSLLLAAKFGIEKVIRSVFYTAIGLFFLVTLKDKAQAGIRYFLPIYPVFFVLSGGVAAYLWKKGQRWRLAVGALLAWHAVSALLVFPHPLAYFNEAVGGPKNGAHYLRDSNIDWGQDLKGLGEVIAKLGADEVVLYSISPADPAVYGIPYRRPEKDEFAAPRATVYAIGAHQMDALGWTKDLKPDKIIGYSMFVYDLRKEKRL